MPWEAYTYITAAKRFLDHHLKEHAYDVCHAHFILPTGPVAQWVKQKHGIPYVLTAHGSDVEGYNQKTYMKALHILMRPVWRQIVADAYAAAAPSRYLLRLMHREMRGGRFVWIPNGLDIKKYETDGKNKEKRILMMGRMQKAKNYQTVLKAVSMIPDDIWADWQVDLLGDGPYRQELEKLCERLAIGGRVTFRGWIDNGTAEQMEYLRRASIYISASRFENCPMAVLESVAAGCFPLLSDIEGHRQFLGSNTEKEQCFFPADDTERLAELMRITMEKERPVRGTYFDISGYDCETVCRRYLRLLKRAGNSIIH